MIEKMKQKYVYYGFLIGSITNEIVLIYLSNTGITIWV